MLSPACSSILHLSDARLMNTTDELSTLPFPSFDMDYTKPFSTPRDRVELPPRHIWGSDFPRRVFCMKLWLRLQQTGGTDTFHYTTILLTSRLSNGKITLWHCGLFLT